MNKFNSESAPVPQQVQPNYADRQFLHTFLAGAFLPLVQATITAVVIFIGTLAVLYLFEAIDILKPALVVAVISWVAMWLYLERRWLTLTSVERITGIDINGDGVIGKPRERAEPLVIRLDETKDGHFRSRRMSVDISLEQLQELAQMLMEGVPFTERALTGSGKPLSSGQFRKLRSDWLKQDLVTVVSDRDHRQGFDFTEEGWALIAKLAGFEEAEVLDEEE